MAGEKKDVSPPPVAEEAPVSLDPRRFKFNIPALVLMGVIGTAFGAGGVWALFGATATAAEKRSIKVETAQVATDKDVVVLKEAVKTLADTDSRLTKMVEAQQNKMDERDKRDSQIVVLLAEIKAKLK